MRILLQIFELFSVDEWSIIKYFIKIFSFILVLNSFVYILLPESSILKRKTLQINLLFRKNNTKC